MKTLHILVAEREFQTLVPDDYELPDLFALGRKWGYITGDILVSLEFVKAIWVTKEEEEI